jgi:hypothetical protein
MQYSGLIEVLGEVLDRGHLDAALALRRIGHLQDRRRGARSMERLASGRLATGFFFALMMLGRLT